MTWTAALVIVPGVCYALAALIYSYQGNWPMAIVFSGYSFSNCGLWWLDKITGKAL